MKTNPSDNPVVDSLRAGILSRDGFMGSDTRPFTQVILDDAALLARAGSNAVELADKMEQLTQAGLAQAGVPVTVGSYLVTVEEYMGRISCPFRDHRAPKRNTLVVDKDGRQMMWTDLGIHLIKKHGFFQGEGSPYRLDPTQLHDFLKDL